MTFTHLGLNSNALLPLLDATRELPTPFSNRDFGFSISTIDQLSFNPMQLSDI